MLIPSASVASSDDEALRGLLLSTMTAMMKASKTNSVSPLQHLFRERLKDRLQRKELNRALFAITTALSRKKDKGAKDNIKKAGVYDNVISKDKRPSLKDLEVMIRTINYSDQDWELLGVYAQELYEIHYKMLLAAKARGKSS